MNTFRRLFLLHLLLWTCSALHAQNLRLSMGSLDLEIDPATGGIQSMRDRTDSRAMNWILASDGSQYAWQTAGQAWGLGFCKINGTDLQWNEAAEIAEDGSGQLVRYTQGELNLTVTRSRGRSGGMVESYRFANPTDQPMRITEIGIYTPYNDNYPDAATCLEQRCHAHIWAGYSSSYVFAQRMGGAPPHLGLVLTEGALTGYEIMNRGPETGSSNVRGTIVLNPADLVLEPGESRTLTWEIFPCRNRNDFFSKARTLGMVSVKASDFVVEKNEEIVVRFTSLKELPEVQCFLNGNPIEFTQSRNYVQVNAVPETTGEQVITLRYGEDQATLARFYRIADIDALIQKRIEFIVTRQWLRDSHDPRNRAFMVYDNEKDAIYLNNDGRQSSDTNEGRERISMGILLVKYLQRHPNPDLQRVMEQYHAFVRNKLQSANYTTYSGVDKKGHRGYNYPWVAQFYLELYKLTRNPEYLTDCYETLRRFCSAFDHAFYAIGIPASECLQQLEKAGREEEYERLLADLTQLADYFVDTGLAYPKSEVNYEQSIVAPSVVFLLEMYEVTREKKYLDEARRQMEPLEAFSGKQPDYHLYDIAIRHWDGYWFGKRRFFGDTMPHYWSNITAEAFLRFGAVTGNKAYAERAKSIVRSNLCVFFEDGRASCAYLYPRKVNGEEAAFFDPFANDQDWALVHYLEYLEADK